MQFRGWTDEQLESALRSVNAVYGDNVEFRDWTRPYANAKVRQFTLRVKDSSGPGARLSAHGRKTINASWEVHRDFMWALFDVNPNGVIKTQMARYEGRDDFIDKHKATRNTPQGSRANPVAFGDLTLVK
jgi:hypothetical protein